MTKRIMIVGAGGNQVGVIQKAREMGLFTVAVDGNAEAPGLAHADAAEAVNILDADALAVVAKRHRVDGIYAAAELAVEAVARVATDLGLPGVPPEVAHRVRNKHALRQALAAAGLPNPAFHCVKASDEAEDAAREIGFPVIVKPADANASKGVTRVDYVEDISLAFIQAHRNSRANGVLVEEFMEGEEFCVDGLVYDGVYRLGGITGKERSAPPYRYDQGIFMPPRQDEDTCRRIEDATARALSAIGFVSGTTHAEVIITGDLVRIVEIAGRPGGGRIPTDLIPLAYGTDFVADCLRVALGEAPREQRRFERGAALYWFVAGAGKVTAIEGQDGALALPGVKEIVMTAKPGAVLGHIVDCVSRDNVGYVLTTGATADEAIAIAKKAQDVCRILTKPVCE